LHPNQLKEWFVTPQYPALVSEKPKKVEYKLQLIARILRGTSIKLTTIKKKNNNKKKTKVNNIPSNTILNKHYVYKSTSHTKAHNLHTKLVSPLTLQNKLHLHLPEALNLF